MDSLHKIFDELQVKFGDKQLHSVYGNGCRNNPKLALVFMNPTKRNIATNMQWNGIRAQWLGTKQVWNFLTKCQLFDSNLNDVIQSQKPNDWTPEFCNKVYKVVKENGIWITNLAKCTQNDAKPLPNYVFENYKDLLKEELYKICPQKIIFFGNQVSSIMLDQKINVSTSRCKEYKLIIKDKEFSCYSVYYPVGNGIFNQYLAIEDIKSILEK